MNNPKPLSQNYSAMAHFPAETISVKSRVLNCDGGEGPLGHPRIFLNMGAATSIDCPYCGRHYVLAPGAGDDSHGH